jgi:H+/Cl- antiporter ClcA
VVHPVVDPRRWRAGGGAASGVRGGRSRLIGRSGSAAVLSGLYGSPPGGAVYESDDLSPSKALVFVAAVTGAHRVPADVEAARRHRSRRPRPAPYAATHDGVDLLRALVPAALAGAAAAGYTVVRPALARLVRRCGPTTLQTLVATVAFAGLAAASPVLRFSGHTEFPELVSLAGQAAWWSLLGVGLLKLLACAICLAAGWRGGEFFPLMFSGAAVGTATVAFVPGLEVTGGSWSASRRRRRRAAQTGRRPAHRRVRGPRRPP